MVCRRLEQITSFIVMDVLERAQEMERAGESVIHLEVGEPDFNTPEAVKNSAIEALSRGDTHYTHSLGTPGLREAICSYYEQTYGVRNIDPNRAPGNAAPATNASEGLELVDPCSKLVRDPLPVARSRRGPHAAAMDIRKAEREAGVPPPPPFGVIHR